MRNAGAFQCAIADLATESIWTPWAQGAETHAVELVAVATQGSGDTHEVDQDAQPVGVRWASRRRSPAFFNPQQPGQQRPQPLHQLHVAQQPAVEGAASLPLCPRCCRRSSTPLGCGRVPMAQAKMHKQRHGLDSQEDGRHRNHVMIIINQNQIWDLCASRAANQNLNLNQNQTARISESQHCSSDACRSSWGPNVHNQFGMHLLGHIPWGPWKCTESPGADRHFCCRADGSTLQCSQVRC